MIPAFATLYQRLTLPESTRFEASQQQKRDQDQDESNDEIKKLKALQSKTDEEKVDSTNSSEITPEVPEKKKAHITGELIV